MPEIAFYLDSTDEAELATSVLAIGGTLVPDLRYETPVPQFITTYEAFRIARTKTRLFFVMFPECIVCPLELRRIGRGVFEGKYYVTQRVGGPTIELLCCTETTAAGETWLSDGFIAHYPTFRNTLTEVEEAYPRLLLRRYREIVRQLQIKCELITGRSKKWLIGPHTKKRQLTGALQLAGAGGSRRQIEDERAGLID